MKKPKKLLAIGAMLPVFAVLAMTAPVGATATMAKGAQKAALATDSNAVIAASTEVDCMSHSLTVKVKNTSNEELTPKITYNGQDPLYLDDLAIQPGKERSYFWSYNGNYLMTKIVLSVDGQEDLTLNPTLTCAEPVTFTATEASESTIVGTLSNNSSLLPQTVLLRVGAGDVRTEILEPGETRLISLPYTGYEDQKQATVWVTTAAGIESNYTINLEHPSSQLPIIVFDK
jgi:hypothetical protein